MRIIPIRGKVGLHALAARIIGNTRANLREREGLAVAEWEGVLLPFLGAVALGAAAVLLLIALSPGRWRDRGRPVVSVRARVVGKRPDVSSRPFFQENGPVQMQTDTAYYVTFQTEDGRRLEFRTDGARYGLLAESDEGVLMYRGSTFLHFERDAERVRSLAR